MASWIPPTTLATGSPLPSSAWNNLANDTTFLAQTPYLSMNLTSTQPIGSGGYTTCTPMGATFSNYGWEIGAGFAAICPLAGSYHFSFRAAFGNADAGYAFTQLFLNGNAIIFGSTTPLFASFTGGIVSQSTGSGILPCNAGDEIFLATLQNSGGDVNVVSGSAYTAVEAFYIGFL